MYHRFFGMERKPFGVAPDPRSYCPLSGSEEAIAALRYVILQRNGIGLVVGAEGLGKTTVCMRLAAILDPTYAVALVSQTNFATVKALYQAIHYDLGLPYYGMDEQELRLSLSDFMMSRLVAGGRTVLVIDDAQNLPVRVLEEIRLLSEAEAQGARLVSVVLAAHPRIAGILKKPEMRSLRYRIAAQAKLEPLSDLETATYIRHQIRQCGGEPARIITDDGIEAVYEATGGIPRLINRLCDHAMIIAFATERKPVDREIVEAAWADLTADIADEVSSAETPPGVSMTPEEAVEACVVTVGSDADPTIAAQEEVLLPSHQLETTMDTAHTVPLQSDSEPQEWVVDDPVARLEATLLDGPQPEPETPTPAADSADEREDAWESVEVGPDDAPSLASILNLIGPIKETVSHGQVSDAPGQQEGTSDIVVKQHGPHPAPEPHRPASPARKAMFSRLPSNEDQESE